MARVRRTRQQNTIKVTISPLFGEVKQISLPEDSTVAEALEAAGMATSLEVRINGAGTVSTDTVVEDGDELIVMSDKKVEAGC